VKKHAFLVIAHQDQRLLQQLVSLLDDDRNAVYVLIDSKSNLQGHVLSTKYASLTLMPKVPVYWGGVSTIGAELDVLRAASAGGYHYYHLISGADLPIVSQDRLHDRLEDSDLEYVDVDPGCEAFARWKVAYYHPLVETRPYRRCWPYRMIGHAFIKLQAKVGIDRTRRTRTRFSHGSAFFSITHALAQYVLERERWVRARFKYTVTCDEVFIQTLAMRSPFQSRIAGRNGLKTGNLRYIDWERKDKNSPYTFRMTDLDELKEASEHYLFARKFNRAVDHEIVDTIVERVGAGGDL